MANNFPVSFNNLTGNETLASWDHAAETNSLEAKIGIDNSADVTSLDYLLKNSLSEDPGHKHTPLSLDLNIPLTMIQSATPTNPAASSNKLYFKSDGQLYRLDSAGVESLVGGTTLSKATGAEVNTGTDDAKYVTPKAIADSTIGKSPATASENVEGIDNTKYLTALANVPAFNAFVYRQALINPNCEVAQIAAVNLTSGKLFGAVDMFYAKGEGTAVSAGTIAQTTSSACGNSGYGLLLSGITLTGTGKVHVYTFIESLSAKLYKNKTASFSVKVYHNVGSAINYVIKINKANSADNFSAVTNISSASAQSVANTTETLIKFENVALGDCSNGIEIEIEAACGAITTKNFEFTDWQFNLGSVVLTFACSGYDKELSRCQRYYYTTGTGAQIWIHALSVDYFYNNGQQNLPVTMRATPTVHCYGYNSNTVDSLDVQFTSTAKSVSVGYANKNKFLLQGVSSNLTASTGYIGYWTADARPTIA